MIRTFQALRHVQPGFSDPAGLQTLRVFIPEAQVKEPVRVVRMDQEMQQKLAAIPGVSSVAFANSVPTDGNNSTDLLYAEDRFYRGGTASAAAPLQVRRSGILSDHGDPADRGTRFHLDRYLRSEKHLHRLGEHGAGTLARSVRGTRQADSRGHEGLLARDRRRGRRCTARRRRSEGSHRRVLADPDDEFLGQSHLRAAGRGLRGAHATAPAPRAFSSRSARQCGRSTPTSPSRANAPWNRCTASPWRAVRSRW